MSKSQITPDIIPRIENNLEILADEMAKLLDPPRRGPTELHLLRTIEVGSGTVRTVIREIQDPLGRSLVTVIEDCTFDPGEEWPIRTIVSGDDMSQVRTMLWQMRRSVVVGLRQYLARDPEAKEAAGNP